MDNEDKDKQNKVNESFNNLKKFVDDFDKIRSEEECSICLQIKFGFNLCDKKHFVCMGCCEKIDICPICRGKTKLLTTVDMILFFNQMITQK